MKSLCVVVPVYQTAKTLDELCHRLFELKIPGYQIQYVFVDDGSTDNAFSVLNRILQENPQEKMEVIRFTRNFGQIPAIQAGLQATQSDLVAIISADLQEDPELIVEMFNCLKDGVQVVLATRETRQDNPFTRMMSVVFYWFVRRFVLVDYPKSGFDCCLMTRQVKEELLRQSLKDAHIFVMIFWLGFKYEILPYERRERKVGKSQWPFWKRFKLFVDTVVGYSYFPMRFMSFTGGVVAILASIYGFVIVIDAILSDRPVQGWSTLVVLITMFGGLTVLTMGVLGEYMWRTLSEARHRSDYVIERKASSASHHSEKAG